MASGELQNSGQLQNNTVKDEIPITIDYVIKTNITHLYNIQHYRYPNCHAKLLIC